MTIVILTVIPLPTLRLAGPPTGPPPAAGSLAHTTTTTTTTTTTNHTTNNNNNNNNNDSFQGRDKRVIAGVPRFATIHTHGNTWQDVLYICGKMCALEQHIWQHAWDLWHFCKEHSVYPNPVWKPAISRRWGAEEAHGVIAGRKG